MVLIQWQNDISVWRIINSVIIKINDTYGIQFRCTSPILISTCQLWYAISIRQTSVIFGDRVIASINFTNYQTLRWWLMVINVLHSKLMLSWRTLWYWCNFCRWSLERLFYNLVRRHCWVVIISTLLGRCFSCRRLVVTIYNLNGSF